MWSLYAVGGNHYVVASGDFMLKFRISKNICISKEAIFTRFVQKLWFSENHVDVPVVVNLERVLAGSTGDVMNELGAVDTHTAVLMPNYFKFSTRVFEIKPKWSGWLPLSDEGCLCKYCSHQKRLTDGSQYCPRNLFSSSFAKIHAAVSNYPFKQKASPADLSLIANILYRDGILDLLHKAHHESVLRAPLVRIPSLKDFYSYIFDCIASGADDDLLIFMASFAVRDCSVIVIVDDEFDPAHKFVEFEDSKVSYQVKLIDLDLKDASKIPVYLEEIKRFYPSWRPIFSWRTLKPRSYFTESHQAVSFDLEFITSACLGTKPAVIERGFTRVTASNKSGR